MIPANSLPRLPRLWNLAQGDVSAAPALSGALGLTPRLGRLLCARGLSEPSAAERYLRADRESIHPAGLLKGLDQAVATIHRAMAHKSPIVIYGDYDVDGLTGSTIVYWTIRRIGGKDYPVRIHIPHRNKGGYGLTVEAMQQLAAEGVRLVVTIDNGTTAFREVQVARDLGMDLVVTDHHYCSGEMPPATAIINPLQPGCPYPFKGLASAGLAHKLGGALLAASTLPDRETLVARFHDATVDLVAVGTIADMVPLIDENRALVRWGLEKMGRTDHPGLRCLMAEDGVGSGPMTAEWVAFKLAPRLNAASRIADPRQALDFLLARKPDEAASLARTLTSLNKKRTRMVDDLWRRLQAEGGSWKDNLVPVVPVASPYKGLMGLLASKLKDAMARPTIVVAHDGDQATGSGRSVEGFHLTEALGQVGEHLERYGGHSQACGLTVRMDRLAGFQAALDEVARRHLTPEMLAGRLDIHEVLDVDQLDGGLLDDLDQLEPCGVGNPSPRFLIAGLPIRTFRRVGKDGRHAVLESGSLPAQMEVVGFGLASTAEQICTTSAKADLVVAVERAGPGRSGVRLRIEDMRLPQPQGMR